MNELLSLFVNILLPIFLIAGVGILLARFTQIDPRSISQLFLYVFGPCMIFSLLTQSEASNLMFGRIVGFSLVFIFLLGLIAWGLGKVMKSDRATRSSMMLAVMFSNAGNYGLPIVLFAFGQPALGFASIYFVVNIILAYTAGTLIASMSSMDLSRAFINLLKLPLIYAVLLAVLFSNTGWEIPLPLSRATKLLGDAAIPCMLILLGMQLKSASLKGKIAPVAWTSALRLVFSPILALALLPLFGLYGPAHQAVALQTGMPSAVMTTMLATEFDAEPGFSTAAVFLTTMLSPLTLIPLLSWLGA